MEGVSEERLKDLICQVKSSGSLCITIDDDDNFSSEQIAKLKQENIKVGGTWIPELNKRVRELICFDKDPRKTKEFQNPECKLVRRSDGWGFYPF